MEIKITQAKLIGIKMFPTKLRKTKDAGEGDVEQYLETENNHPKMSYNVFGFGKY